MSVGKRPGALGPTGGPVSDPVATDEAGRTIVGPTDEMGPWRLRKHINLRHIPRGDYRSEHEKDGRVIVYDLAELSMRKCYRDDRPATEAYHQHCHDHYPERYDHVHE